MSSADTVPSPLREEIDAFLKGRGFPSGVAAARPLAGGRNNRIFSLDPGAASTPTPKPLLLKSYFHDPRDPRDRLRQETDFIGYAWGQGVRSLPECLGIDPDRRLALFECVRGERADRLPISPGDVDQAAAFFRETNAPRLSPEGLKLLPASEACFAPGEHVAIVERRIARLEQMEDDLPVDLDARAFVSGELLPLWLSLAAAIDKAVTFGTLPSSPLPQDERCISPSDFGFHNAIREPSGSLRFLDFEYAGWDDPAKLIADFANQPDLLLPAALSARFTRAVIETSPRPESLLARILFLTPLYQLKWACIILNDFLPIGRTRRTFTAGSEEEIALKSSQLAKARIMHRRAAEAIAALPR